MRDPLRRAGHLAPAFVEMPVEAPIETPVERDIREASAPGAVEPERRMQ